MKLAQNKDFEKGDIVRCHCAAFGDTPGSSLVVKVAWTDGKPGGQCRVHDLDGFAFDVLQRDLVSLTRADAELYRDEFLYRKTELVAEAQADAMKFRKETKR